MLLSLDFLNLERERVLALRDVSLLLSLDFLTFRELKVVDARLYLLAIVS